MDPMHPLLELINLDHPGLEAVREAAEQRKLSEAMNALVDYFRARVEPDPALLVQANANHVEAADRVVRREFTFYNEPGTVPPGDYDWTYKPGTDWEWTWALNRHFHWHPLAAAYLATEDEKYALELANEVRTWVGNHPATTDDLAVWRTIEAGLRMKTWPGILDVMKRSPAFSREVWLHFLRSISEHAEFLIAHPKINNWLLMESNGLLTCGLVFPEFKRATEWRHLGIERFEGEMIRQVHPDGAHVEYSTGYIFVCIHNFADVLDKMDRVLGVEHGFSDEYRDRIVAMWEHVMYMMRPDGFQPMLNDGEMIDVRPRLIAAGERYDRPDFMYAATNGERGEAPTDGSHRFPWVRRAVMRCGPPEHPTGTWARDALYGFFEAGPLGAGHVHEDALTFEVMAYGQPLIGTMGRLTYERIPRRQYFCNGLGHNVVLVDGAPQFWKRTHPDRSSWVATEPTDLPWTSNPELDTAYARYDKPWADEQLDGVVHERWMALSKPGDDGRTPFWLLKDKLSGGPDGERELRTLFHLYPGAELNHNDETGVATVVYPSGAGVHIVISDVNEMTFDAAIGQDDPVRGWYSEEYGKIEPAWELAAVRRSVLPVEYVVALVPFRDGSALDVHVASTDDGAVVVVNNREIRITL
jgi:hypothetical protein